MVTIKDIAREAQVSVGTVSYALNNDKRVKEETKQKVLEVAKKLNYSVNGLARDLKTNKSDIIILFVSSFAGPIYQEIFGYLHNYLKSYGYKMVVSNGDLATNLLLERKAAGAINLDSTIETELLIRASSNGLAIVDATRPKINDSIVSCAMTGYEPVYEITKEVIEKGYKEIGFISYSHKSYDNEERLRAFNDALKEKDLKPTTIIEAEFTQITGKEAIKKYYEEGGKLPEVFISSNDEMAIGAIEYLNSIGIKVPEDIKVIGFDDIELDQYFKPSLTTIKVDRNKWSKDVSRTIINMIEEKKISDIDIEYKIIKRDSFK